MNYYELTVIELTAQVKALISALKPLANNAKSTPLKDAAAKAIKSAEAFV